MADAAAVPSHLSSDAPMAGRVCVPPGNGAWVLRCVNPVSTLEGVPEAAFSSLLDPACNWKFVFCVFFQTTSLSIWEWMGHLRRLSLYSPCPVPVCRGTLVVLPEHFGPWWGSCVLARWQGLLSLRDGRLLKAQTSGAGWVPCVVYGRESEIGGPSSKGATVNNLLLWLITELSFQFLLPPPHAV